MNLVIQIRILIARSITKMFKLKTNSLIIISFFCVELLKMYQTVCNPFI